MIKQELGFNKKEVMQDIVISAYREGKPIPFNFFRLV